MRHLANFSNARCLFKKGFFLLISYGKMRGSLRRTTRTAAGLRVRAHLVKKAHKTGVKVADAQMRELRITDDSVLPKWNYTIEPIEPM